MATTTRKGSQNKKAKLRRPMLNTSVAEQAQTIAELRQELEARNHDLAESLQRESATAKKLQDRNRQLTESLEQQTATSDILGVISSVPTNLQPVFDTIAKHSVKLCGALFSSVYRFDGELIHMVAHHNYPPIALERSLRLFPTRPGRHLFTARAILDRSVINVPDVAKDSEHVAHSATAKQILSDMVEEARFRSVLSVPML